MQQNKMVGAHCCLEKVLLSVTGTTLLLDLPRGCFTSTFAVFLMANVQGSGCSKAGCLVSALSSLIIVCYSAAAAIAVEILSTVQTFVYQTPATFFCIRVFLLSAF